jgi:hypothetical protein
MPNKDGTIFDRKLFHLADLEERRELQTVIGRLDGDYRVTIKPGRPSVSDPQRGYWFGVICEVFGEFMREHDPSLTPLEAKDSAHMELKRRFLPQPIHDADGILIAERVGSLTKIDKPRMSRLIDDAINWLGSNWNIAVPPPNRLERFGEPDKQPGPQMARSA